MRRALLLLLLLATAACAPRREVPDAVVLVFVDTLRADHLGCYGKPDAHTPNLDALARGGTRFDDVTTPVPVTLPATASMLTGRWPFRHQVRDNDGFTLGGSEVTLAERFRAAGWRTGAVVASAVLSEDRGLARGFETYDDDFVGPYPVHDPAQESLADELARSTRRATDVTDRAIATLERFGSSEPWFLLAHYFDPHTQHDPPPEFARLHPGSGYAGEISYTDHEVGRLVDHVRARTPGALIVVVSDHGEGLGEHGEIAHGFLLHQSTLRVPMILAGPGIPAGGVRSEPVSLVDLEPTLAALLDLPKAGAPRRDGIALRFDRPNPPRDLYAETMRTLIAYDWSELRAVRRDAHKLIVDRAGSTELFDLAVDPAETLDRHATDPATATRLVKVLSEWTGHEDAEAIKREAEAKEDPARAQLLASLGYVGGESSPTAERPHPKDRLPAWTERQARKARLREGMGLVEAGLFDRGIAKLDEVLAADPADVDALYYRGLAREAVGRSAEGRRDLDEAERLDPTYLPLQLEFAAREEESGRHADAWKRLESLPPTPQVLLFLGESYRGRGRHEQAARALATLVDTLQPQNLDARLMLADSLVQLGRESEARPHLQVVTRLARMGDARRDQAEQMLRALGN